MLYRVCAQVAVTDKPDRRGLSWSSSDGVPMFYVEADSAADAEDQARRILSCNVRSDGHARREIFPSVCEVTARDVGL